VDIGGKKDFIKSRAQREIPAVDSIQTLSVNRWHFSEFSGTLLQEQTCVPSLLVLALSILYAGSLFSQNHIAGSQSPSPTSLEKELRQADLDFAKQTADRRLEGWISFFANDASIIQDGQTVTGKDALRAFYQPVFANKDFSLTWSPTHAEASTDGTLGYTYGEYEARSGLGISHGIYTTVWRKVDGRWKVVLDLGSAARSPG
jgi:ketosteroid isomerase-like protein